MKTLNVSDEVHNSILMASKKTGLQINKLVELLVTVNLNWMNNPVKVGEKMAMVTVGNIKDAFSKSEETR